MSLFEIKPVSPSKRSGFPCLQSAADRINGAGEYVLERSDEKVSIIAIKDPETDDMKFTVIFPDSSKVIFPDALEAVQHSQVQLGEFVGDMVFIEQVGSGEPIPETITTGKPVGNMKMKMKNRMTPSVKVNQDKKISNRMIPDAFKESEHDRDKDGKFTSTGGGSAGSVESKSNNHVDLVKKWLADPKSVSPEDLEANRAAADSARDAAEANLAAADEAVTEAWAASDASDADRAAADAAYDEALKARDAADAAYWAADYAAGGEADAAKWVEQHEEKVKELAGGGPAGSGEGENAPQSIEEATKELGGSFEEVAGVEIGEDASGSGRGAKPYSMAAKGMTEEQVKAVEALGYKVEKPSEENSAYHMEGFELPEGTMIISGEDVDDFVDPENIKGALEGKKTAWQEQEEYEAEQKAEKQASEKAESQKATEALAKIPPMKAGGLAKMGVEPEGIETTSNGVEISPDIYGPGADPVSVIAGGLDKSQIEALKAEGFAVEQAGEDNSEFAMIAKDLGKSSEGSMSIYPEGSDGDIPVDMAKVKSIIEGTGGGGQSIESPPKTETEAREAGMSEKEINKMLQAQQAEKKGNIEELKGTGKQANQQKPPESTESSKPAKKDPKAYNGPTSKEAAIEAGPQKYTRTRDVTQHLDLEGSHKVSFKGQDVMIKNEGGKFTVTGPDGNSVEADSGKAAYKAALKTFGPWKSGNMTAETQSQSSGGEADISPLTGEPVERNPNGTPTEAQLQKEKLASQKASREAAAKWNRENPQTEAQKRLAAKKRKAKANWNEGEAKAASRRQQGAWERQEAAKAANQKKPSNN